MQKKIKVLVVDDSGYVIASVTNKLKLNRDIEIVGSARTGAEAIEKVKGLRPDVVTLDVIMPEMDGLTALKHIMAECPTPVIMLSALTSEHASTTIKALELGAVDFFLKTSVIKPAGNGTDDDTLITKIRMAANANILSKETPGTRPEAALAMNKTPDRQRASFNRLVVIGSSTGGPGALVHVIPYLPKDLPAAILIVQHMPPIFTKSLAERLDQASVISVTEATDGSLIKQGQALLAPGNYHMIVNKRGRIALNQDPPVQGVRPAVDVTMQSVANAYRDSVLGVVLTGMGSDGTAGASFIKAAGGRVLAQDRATSAVYGMPMSVSMAGFVDKVVPLHRMASEIIHSCTKVAARA